VLELEDLLLEEGHLLVLRADEVLVGLQHGLVLLLVASPAVGGLAAPRPALVRAGLAATARSGRLGRRRVGAANLAQDTICALRHY
jgi:hypothetical protein